MSETRKDKGREVFPGGDPFRATPPTPDRAAVREALLAVLNCVEDEPEAYEACERLCAALQVSRDDGFDGIADALLRPAPRHYCRCKTCRAARRPTPRTDG